MSPISLSENAPNASGLSVRDALFGMERLPRDTVLEVYLFTYEIQTSYLMQFQVENSVRISKDKFIEEDCYEVSFSKKKQFHGLKLAAIVIHSLIPLLICSHFFHSRLRSRLRIGNLILACLPQFHLDCSLV